MENSRRGACRVKKIQLQLIQRELLEIIKENLRKAYSNKVIAEQDNCFPLRSAAGLETIFLD